MMAVRLLQVGRFVSYLKSSKRNLQSSEGKRNSRISINGLCRGK